MNPTLKSLSVAIGSCLAVASTGALAEQTIGIQPAGTVASATARVNVRVIVPKIVILRVGDANANISDVTFTVGPSPAVAGAPGNSLPYSGAIPPNLSTTVATTNPTSSAGSLTVGAWTNTSGTLLSCALSPLAGATPFATGATASGVPGTTDITVTSVTGGGNLQAPGTSLASCVPATTSAIPQLATLGGTFTYAAGFTANAVAAGTYGNIVTYTATTL